MLKKNRLFYCVSILILLYFFPGCASLDKADCRQGDWFGIGYEDGTRGYHASQIGKHRKACSKYGVKPDYQEYERGRLKGLEKFCIPQNAYRLGTKGHPYRDVCPDDLKDQFLDAYLQGKIVYQIKNDIKNDQMKIKKLKTGIQRKKEKILSLEKALVKDGIKSNERKKILENIRSLEGDINENRFQMKQYTHRVKENEFDLDRIESQSGFD